MRTSFLISLSTCAVLAVSVGIFSQHPLRAALNGPQYEVDSSWPKPLPDRWVIGGLGGVCVDAQDHVLLLNRQDMPDRDLNAGHKAPALIEIDSAGTVVNSWGDPKLLDPRLHSCFFDKDNNVWIASAPSGMVQKYSHDGSKLLLQIGKKGVYDTSDGTEKGKPLNSDAARFLMPASIFADPQNGDVYLADGEGKGSNRRVAVVDRTGKFLRQWQPEGMRSVHCLIMSNEGLVYVCNREESRIQIYDKMGTLKKTIELPWTPYTEPEGGKRMETGGSVVAIDFSKDANQSLMYVINQNNSEVEILDRQTGKVLSSFGRAGHFPGQFDKAHGIAVDSKGNVYIAENDGRRIQKFKLVSR